MAPRLLHLRPGHEKAFNGANRLVSESGARNVGYTWDPDGNLLTKTMNGDVTRYDWSARNKLTHVLLPNGSTRDYAYYPESDLRRLARDGSGAETSFLWDGRNVLEELDGQGATTGAFINGVDLDDRFAYVTASAACPVVADAVGSIRSLLDPAGTPLNSYSYTAYGLPRATAEILPFAYRFGGQPWDDETELAYVRARYLDPRSGRFISSDPLRERDRYAYAGGNPAAAMDPTGLWVDHGPVNQTLTALVDKAASSILVPAATETYPRLQGANYTISLCASTNDKTLPLPPLEGRTGWNPVSDTWQSAFATYKQGVHSGQFISSGTMCLPSEPLYAVAFFGTFKTLVEVAKRGGPFPWLPRMRPEGWTALTLYHEAQHALNFSNQSESMENRARASERSFYYSLIEVDTRLLKTRIFRTYEDYLIYGDMPYAPR